MAGGPYRFFVTNASSSGGFFPLPGFDFHELPGSIPDNIGNATITYGGGYTIEVSGTAKSLDEVPDGFALVAINHQTLGIFDGSPPPACILGTFAGNCELTDWSSSLGWSPTLGSPFGPSQWMAVFAGFTFSGDYDNHGPNSIFIPSGSTEPSFPLGGTWTDEAPINIPPPIENIVVDGDWDDDTDEGEVIIDFTPPGGDGAVVIIIRRPELPDFKIIAPPVGPITIPNIPGPNIPGIITITPIVFNPGKSTGPPVEVPVIFPSSLTMTMGLTIDIALAMTIQILGNPSGIYTLNLGVFHDNLYEHETTPASSIDVAIPRPYGVTSYIPDGDD